jgi:N-acetylglucosaminyl-diphospho-decaprenol L-rhamnosyltransferase
MPLITVSVVSHGHGALVSGLLADMADCPEVSKVVLTHNIRERQVDPPASLSSRVFVVSNGQPKGFGANHNAAFQYCDTPFFCVINPDVRLERNPFPALLNVMEDDSVAVCAPTVLNPQGEPEDNARIFPTPLNILSRILKIADGRIRFPAGSRISTADWLAGMFMLFRTSSYVVLEGFDEEYFLYCEDADICARAWLNGGTVCICPATFVVHDARRTSHRSLRFVRWHVSSLIRFFGKFRAAALHDRIRMALNKCS